MKAWKPVLTGHGKIMMLENQRQGEWYPKDKVDAEIAELVKLTDEVVFGTEQEMGLLDCADGYYKTSTWDSVKKLRELISKHKKNPPVKEG